MKVNKLITTMQETELEIVGITLLSKEEYKLNNALISAVDGWWWLRSPGDYQYTAAYVIFDGSLYYDYVCLVSACVRPALICNNFESSNLKPGDKIELAGYTWTELNDNLILCDSVVGQAAFRKDWESDDSNDYEKSDIKKWLENWAMENNIEFKK